MSETLNYGQLVEALKDLGYQLGSMIWNEYPQWVFKHPTYPKATIYIAEQPLETPVHPSHLNTVQATLKHHGVVEGEPLMILQALACNNGTQTRRPKQSKA